MTETVGKKLIRGYKFVYPILAAVFIATVLVLITFLSQFRLTATVFSEEGGGGGAATAGLFNAGLFLLVAIVGGFLIFLLFKYRKRNVLQYLFSGALSISGGFILFFFIIILVEDIRYYSTGYLVDSTFFGSTTSDPFFLVFRQANLDGPLFIASVVMGILMTHIVLSGKYRTDQKNRFLLLLSGLMGAFLAVILPTWTVMFMLVGLSFYDIYSVKHGPIKSIIDMTEEERSTRRRALNQRRRRNRAVLETLRRNGISCPSCASHRLFIARGDSAGCTECGFSAIIPGVTGLIAETVIRLEGGVGSIPQRRVVRRRVMRRVKPGSGVRGRPMVSEGRGGIRNHPMSSDGTNDIHNRPMNSDDGDCVGHPVREDDRGEGAIIPFSVFKWFGGGKKRRRRGMDAEHLMKSMTYNTPSWDLGIGDLVFYSMLAGHSFQYGAGYYDKVGIIAPFLMLILSMTGILVGFVITIRLLEKNKILPGLPMSMFIGIFGFLIGAVALWLW